MVWREHVTTKPPQRLQTAFSEKNMPNSSFFSFVYVWRYFVSLQSVESHSTQVTPLTIEEPFLKNLSVNGPLKNHFFLD